MSGMAKQASRTFVGRAPGGGFIRHGDDRGLEGAKERIASVGAKNAAKAAKTRKALRGTR